MELFVITHPEKTENEIDTINLLFKAGLRILHVRKPEFTTKQLTKFIEEIPEEYHKRLVIHSHHELILKFGLKGIHLTEGHRKKKSILNLKLYIYRLLRPKMQLSTTFHHLSSFRKAKRKYAYVIFSPVFESISKKDHGPSFSLVKIQEALEKTKYKVVGLGGVTEDNFGIMKEMGFFGAGVHGAIWKDEHPAERFKKMIALCKRKEEF